MTRVRLAAGYRVTGFTEAESASTIVNGSSMVLSGVPVKSMCDGLPA